MDRLALPALPYALDALDALAPHISRRTLATHHGKHHAAYLDKTRSLVKGTPLESACLTEIGYAAFCQAFTNTAVGQFGRGWAWLVLADGRLQVTATANAGTPLVDGQRRADYVAAFLANLVNWDFASAQLRACVP